ncbi:NAD(P)-binding domain-containing protein [Rhodococcus kroppenstedtii]|uniref:NAD(P)-binding domain-containing protein n=1 Tax=Rhodococcoides kroppenstedtii TaxID=293050 RepID=UPI002953C204|nr:NAD(P)-binding domain-containing protein [Rhodococcus kroppenstedtii]MDV7196931.1 NAD(P)-binding domain-containing protein [Rhodococcus kroppenstedtii]
MQEAVREVEVAVIGAGQAGLSASYFLHRAGLTGPDGHVVLDGSPGPGGAWQFRWPSLTLATVNGVHDLPGLPFAETLGEHDDPAAVPASKAVPHYYAEYERRFDLPVRRPGRVSVVCERGSRYRVEAEGGVVSARGLINATGTWEHPFVPVYPGAATFRGRQLHTKDYDTAEEFRGQRVVVVGGGISAVQLLDEISQVTTTTWVTRREPRFTEGAFGPEQGRAAVARVEERVRAGLPPGSVVSVTGLLLTPALRAARDRGALQRLPMFDEITPTGVRWADGSTRDADVILWATGFRSALDHLAPLRLREPGGGIVLDGAVPTRVATRPTVHLIGYGPSASTIGANRAGRVAVRELLTELGIR